MTDAKSAWRDTSERFSSLGTKLKLHYEQQRGADADQSKAEVRDALHKLTGALEDAFEAIGTAARDDAVKSDVKQVGQSLVSALGATFSEVSAEVQRAFANRGGATDRTSPETPSTATEPATAGPAATEPAATEPAATEPTTGPASTGPATAAPGGAPAATPPAADGEPAPGSTGAAAPGTGSSGPHGEQPPRVEPWGTP